jgi:hypothetical protein
MRRWVRFFAAAAVVISSAIAVGQRTGKDAAPQHHCMFCTEKPKLVAIYDPRLDVTDVQYSPVRGRIIIEGDIDLGTVEEARKSIADHAAELAGKARADAKLLGALKPEEAKLLQQVSRAKDDATVTVEAIQDALTLLKQVERKAANKQFKSMASGIRAGDRKQYRWPDGIIPYEIDPKYTTPNLVKEAIEHWHKKTDRIRLVARSGAKKPVVNWLRFVPGDGCSSRVGKRPDPGEQVITLGEGCEIPQIIHEIGHTVGLFHEQSRNDRHLFLDVKLANVEADMRFNFDLIRNEGDDLGAFDFDSIMLYPAKAFSRNGLPTLSNKKNPKDTNFGIASGALGGRSTGLSKGDIRGVEMMYSEPAKK